MREEKSIEQYRLRMVALLDELGKRASTQHKSRLRAERDWLESGAPQGGDAVALQKVYERHCALPMLLHAVVESADVPDRVALGLEIRDEFMRVDSLINALVMPNVVKERMTRASTDGDDQCSPIFVISSWRSGSTLLMALLGSHEHLVALPESNLLDGFLVTFPEHARNMRPLLYRSRPLIVDTCNNTARFGVTNEQFYACFSRFIDSLLAPYVRARGGRRWIYKETSNIDSLALIDILFGYRARFIWLVRHGLDVVNSEIERYESRGVHCPDLADYAREWALTNELFADFYERTPERCIRMRFEDLITSPEAQVRRILEFLQEPWDEEIFSRMQSETTLIGGDHKFTSSQGKVDSSRTGRWKQWPQVYIDQLGRIVNPMLLRAGYDNL